ncbi:reverse transcriptase [Trichonephila clavipes]|nr:reverse transcriptase [Trichonephila clavipes]
MVQDIKTGGTAKEAIEFLKSQNHILSKEKLIELTYGPKKPVTEKFIPHWVAMVNKAKSLGKPWKTLATVGPTLRHLEGAEAVARFRLTTRRDFLGVYLHWLGLVADEACPLCGHGRMDGHHLLQCTGRDEYPTYSIARTHYKARRQMVKRPSTGVLDK